MSPTSSASPVTTPRPATPIIPCSYAACGRSSTRLEDGWWFCKNHLEEHRRLFHPPPIPPAPKVDPAAPAPVDWRHAWDIITSCRGAHYLDDILGASRIPELVLARDHIIWRIRRETRLSSVQIGRLVDRDHTTVLAAVRREEQRQQAAA